MVYNDTGKILFTNGSGGADELVEISSTGLDVTGAITASIAFITTITGQTLNLLVRPQLGESLSDLHDVQISTASNNDLLVFVSESNRFENRSSDLVLSGSFSGSYTGVYFGDGSNLENVQAAVPTGVVSGSAQIDELINDAIAASIVAEIDNDEIPIAKLAEDAVTVTAGTNLSGGGAVTLGDSITLNVDDAFIKNDADDATTGILTAAGLKIYYSYYFIR